MILYDKISHFARHIDKHHPVFLDIAAIPAADGIHYTFVLSLRQNDVKFSRVVEHNFKKPPLPASIKQRKAALVHALVDEIMDTHGFHRIELTTPKDMPHNYL